MLEFLQRHRQRLLVISLGIVYLWFGTLKFFSGLSPAETLAKETIHLLTFGLIPDHISFLMLAVWEVTIGILLLLNKYPKVIVYLALTHILFTFTPLFLLPTTSFNEEHMYSLTLVGQYIIKNVVLFSALLFLLPAKQSARKI
jgi:uncharacterized membrane protein YkgB